MSPDIGWEARPREKVDGGRGGEGAMLETEATLRRLALHDDEAIRCLLGIDANWIAGDGLEPRTVALVQLAALISVGSAAISYQAAVERAYASGATASEIVATLMAAAPVVGVSRVVAAAPTLAMALGHDVDAALENLD